MKTIGNIIWFIFGGLAMAFGWLIIGALWCVSIIGIPIGLQAFKIARLALFPFGKKVIYGRGAGNLILNMLWLIFGGICLAVGSFIVGCLYCITIIGIPFGKQHFKLAKLALMPFGASISS
ncbi:MAG: YccF domain-containing protein [Dehalococcoidia bacterium]|nr:YccF domain-containing protein [Dehalococcoidia bacterium]